MLQRQAVQAMLEDVAPMYGQVPAAAGGFSTAAPPASYSSISSPLARIEAAQESLLQLQVQLELELQQVQQQVLQQQQQQVQQQQQQQETQLFAAQSWHARSSCAPAAGAALSPGYEDAPYAVSSAAMSPVFAASGAGSFTTSRSCMQSMMQQQQPPNISAAAAAAFYGSSSSDMLPSIPCSFNSTQLLPTFNCTRAAPALPTSYRSTHSSPLPAISSSSSSGGGCYSAVPPVNVCGAGLGSAAVNASGTAAAFCPAVSPGSSSSPRTGVKIQQLMEAQQLQLEIQEELLQLLSLGPM
jgi:hypothetical protein